MRDLELHKPRYVVYSRGTWRIDNIPEQVQVPEIYNYLMQHYLPESQVGDVTMYRRAGN